MLCLPSLRRFCQRWASSPARAAIRQLARSDLISGFGGGLDGAHVGVEIEPFAKGDDGRGVSGDSLTGGAYCSEKGAITFLFESFERSLGESGAFLLKGAEADGELDKGKVELEGFGEGFQDSAAGLLAEISLVV